MSGSFVEPGAHAFARMTCIAERDPLHASAGRSIESGGWLRAVGLTLAVHRHRRCRCSFLSSLSIYSGKIYPAARMRSSGLALREDLLSLSCSAGFSVVHGEKSSLVCLVFFRPAATFDRWKIGDGL